MLRSAVDATAHEQRLLKPAERSTPENMPGAPYNDAYPVGVQLKPYPHVPSDLRADGRRHDDPVGYALAREQRGRERIIAEETVKIVREQVAQCYQREGVNHYQNCKHLTKQYYDLITAPGFGILQPGKE